MKFIIAILSFILLFNCNPASAQDGSSEENQSTQAQQDMVFTVSARYHPTCTTSINEGFRHHNLWLEGNLLASKYHQGYRWKGSFEWFGAGHQPHRNNSAVTLQNSILAARIGYDLADSTYVGVSYKQNRHNFNIAGVGMGTGRWNGFGLGVDKKWKLGEKWDLNTNAHFYPKLSGPENWNYQVIEYEIGAAYKLTQSLNIDVGFRGERGSGRDKAGSTTYCIRGPYLGLTNKF